MSDVDPTRTPAFEARLRKRYAAERRFKVAGLGAILLSLAVLVFLLVTMTMNGVAGFQRASMKVPVDFGAVGLALPPGIEVKLAMYFRALLPHELPIGQHTIRRSIALRIHRYS